MLLSDGDSDAAPKRYTSPKCDALQDHAMQLTKGKKKKKEKKEEEEEEEEEEEKRPAQQP